MKKAAQIKTLKLFEEYINQNNQNYFTGKNFFEIIESENLLSSEHNTTMQRKLPEFITAYFDKIKDLGKFFTPNEILESIYKVTKKQEINSKLENYRNLCVNSNTIREVLFTIDDPVLLSQLFLEFLETLSNPCITTMTLSNMKFLIKNHLIFDTDSWRNNYLLSQKKINESEMILLIKINKFYRQMTDYSSEAYLLSLTRIIIALLQIRDKFEANFEGRTLIDTSLYENAEAKVLRNFIDFLKPTKERSSILKENLSIINSPLRNFSINRKNKSAFSKKGENDQSVDMTQILDRFYELDTNSKKMFYTKIKEAVSCNDSINESVI
jgi:hypothetical protein